MSERMIYSGCGCEVIEHFPDYCPECRIAELEAEKSFLHGVNEGLADNLQHTQSHNDELKAQIEAAEICIPANHKYWQESKDET